jgi:hypothetical protein
MFHSGRQQAQMDWLAAVRQAGQGLLSKCLGQF